MSRTYGEVEVQEGTGIASRAEVIAAMDCLVSHLKNEDLMAEWPLFGKSLNNNILDWDPSEGANRLEAYVSQAQSMSDMYFEEMCKRFLDIMKMAMEQYEYKKGSLI